MEEKEFLTVRDLMLKYYMNDYDINDVWVNDKDDVEIVIYKDGWEEFIATKHIDKDNSIHYKKIFLRQLRYYEDTNKKWYLKK